MRAVELAACETGFLGDTRAVHPAGDDVVDVLQCACSWDAEDGLQGLVFGSQQLVQGMVRARCVVEDSPSYPATYPPA